MTTTPLMLGLACISTLSTPAFAQDADAPLDPTLPIPTLELERLPPSTSYELALQLSYGQLTYWKEYVPHWVGFGVRGGWGKHAGNNRFGIDVTFVAEGPLGVHMTLGLEPHLAYNMVSSRGLLLGAGVGPAFLYHAMASESPYLSGTTGTSIAPSVAGRVGWSQTWSSIGRRLFVFVEPKMRVINGSPNAVVALAVGSGMGS